MFGASTNPSTTSLTSVATATTVTSTTPLRSNTQKSERDYLATFGALQMAYGFGGVAPTRPDLSKSKKEQKKSQPNSTSDPSPSAQLETKSRSPTANDKTFGDFATAYGFNGTAPTVPTVTPTDFKKNLKFWRRST